MKREVILTPGQSKPVNFAVAPSSPGNYDIELNGLTRQFVVIGEAEPTYLYYEGLEYVPWVPGNAGRGAGSQTKDSNNLFIHISGSSRTTFRTWVTNSLIDLSAASRIFVDWAAVGEDGTTCRSHLVVSGNKMGGPHDDIVKAFARGRRFSRTIQELDISDVVGSYYIRLHAEDADNGNPWIVALRTYGVWIE